MRKIKFANGEYYHIYNRGIGEQGVFCSEKDYIRFLSGMREFNDIKPVGSLYIKNKLKEQNKIRGKTLRASKRLLESESLVNALVQIVCYCLNPNHYHLILKQLADGGISKFMLKLGMGYANYFNVKNSRSGSLFQGPFQSIHIDTNEYLLWLSGYINGNAEIHRIAKVENYKWCSYSDYLGKRNGTLCAKDIILSQFKNLNEYQSFVNMVIRESRKRKDMEKYFIEML